MANNSHSAQLQRAHEALILANANLQIAESKLKAATINKAIAELKVKALNLVKVSSIPIGKTFHYWNRLYIRVKPPLQAQAQNETADDSDFVYAAAISSGFNVAQLEVTTLVRPMDFEITNMHLISNGAE